MFDRRKIQKVLQRRDIYNFRSSDVISTRRQGSINYSNNKWRARSEIKIQLILAIFHLSVPKSVYLWYTICHYTIIERIIKCKWENMQLWKLSSLLTQVQCVWQIFDDATTTKIIIGTVGYLHF